ncbi:hypothetical protein [Rubricoccus marinus]|uniref:Uncharacterized protein n=1 Tax=Rubricoccus marinus TaxID=716817 RepID=A0A259TYV1_9BACT|nr:hypothetical protein [Rubricoccus marinus]OZC02929.1 hypothetical protein BSZ36_08055 [Rubricoccus marinus]
MRALPVLLLAVFAFGCHEYSVEPEPLAPLPSENLDLITLKGPRIVSPGDLPTYLAQSHPEAVRYRFQINNPSQPVMGSIDTNDDRHLNAEVLAQGSVELVATAYNAAGERIAQGRHLVESR